MKLYCCSRHAFFFFFLSPCKNSCLCLLWVPLLPFQTFSGGLFYSSFSSQSLSLLLWEAGLDWGKLLRRCLLCSLTMPVVLSSAFLKHMMNIVHCAIDLLWPVSSLIASTATSLLGASSHQVSAWHPTATRQTLFKGVDDCFLQDRPTLDSLLVTHPGLLGQILKQSGLPMYAVFSERCCGTFNSWSFLGSVYKPQKIGWLKFVGSIWFRFRTDELFGSSVLNTNLLNPTICWRGFYFRGEHLGPHLHLLRLIDLTTFLCSQQEHILGLLGFWGEAAELFTGCCQMHSPHWKARLYSILILLFLKVIAFRSRDCTESINCLN